MAIEILLCLYQVVGPVLYNDQNLTMYKWEETRGYKKNTYKLIVATVFTSSIPVHLHFLGFDWIFGSHYDEYEFFYDEFNLGIEIPEETFNVPEGECIVDWSKWYYYYYVT